MQTRRLASYCAGEHPSGAADAQRRPGHGEAPGLDDGAGHQRLPQPRPSAEPGSLASYPLLTSTLVPTTLGAGSDKTALVLGDWSELMIGYWSELDILVNPYESSAYSKGNVQVRAMATCDVAVRHPEAFCAAVDI